MAKAHAKAAVFKIHDSADSLKDLSADCDTTELQREISTAEVTTFGATGSARSYVPGLITANVPIGGKWDPASNQVDSVLSGIVAKADTVTWEYGPQGSTSGQVKYTGEGILTSYNVSSPVDGAVTWSGNVLVSAAITRTTWA